MDKSPLQRLPPEIRNEIYDLVLTQEWPIALWAAYTPSTKPEPEHADDDEYPCFACCSTDHNLLAITKTCRALRKETAGLVFSSNIFSINLKCSEGWYLDLADLAEHFTNVFTSFTKAVTPENATAIKELRLEINELESVGQDEWQQPLPAWDQLQWWDQSAEDFATRLRELRIGISCTSAQHLHVSAAIPVTSYTPSKHPWTNGWPFEQRTRQFAIHIEGPAASLRGAAALVDQEEPVLNYMDRGEEDAPEGISTIPGAQAEIQLVSSFLRYVAGRLQDPAASEAVVTPLVLDGMRIMMFSPSYRDMH